MSIEVCGVVVDLLDERDEAEYFNIYFQKMRHLNWR